MSHSSAIILSCSGTKLTDDEKRFFASANPLGFILFARNCEDHDQIRKLNHDLRDCVGWDCPILIDQEGGRVQRLKPPVWQQYMPANACNTSDEAAGVARFIGHDLAELNIDVNCAPVMDLLLEETHNVIGDRAFSDNPDDIFEKAYAVCNAYLECGVTPVAKHIPGHGRATSDSHLELPVVDTPLEELEQTDFLPFQKLGQSNIVHQVWGMVAHIKYPALSALPATISKEAIEYIRGTMNIDQFLIADDISMKALEEYGNLADRARKTLESGCDTTLYCSGLLTEMESIMADIPAMSDQSFERYERSRIRRRSAA
ncbi:MAG: glycoside hydrolase family 3 N-terminal domain-containing protein [Pseudomonadota bacterium]